MTTGAFLYPEIKRLQKKQEKLLILQEQVDIIGKRKNVRSPVKLSVT